MELETGDVVLCTVEKIERTTVFVKIPVLRKEIEGSMTISEIAPGRIRNLRDYVVPKKKIVCKVLRISNGRVELSLRRVTQKERKEVLEEYEKERSYINILKSVMGEKAEEAIEEISKQERILDFLNEEKENPRKLEKIVGKENSQKIIKIIKAQKPRKIIVKKEISLRTTKPNGLELIKGVLEKIREAEVKYISGGKYSLKIESESENAKITDNKLKEIINKIEKEAKNKEIEFSITEK